MYSCTPAGRAKIANGLVEDLFDLLDFDLDLRVIVESFHDLWRLEPVLLHNLALMVLCYPEPTNHLSLRAQDFAPRKLTAETFETETNSTTESLSLSS